MNVLFLLKNFQNFDDVRDYFLSRIYNEEHKPYFKFSRNMKKMRPNDYIFFIFRNIIIAKAKFMNYNPNYGYELEEIKVFDKDININFNIFSKKIAAAFLYLDDNDTNKILNLIKINVKKIINNLQIKNIILYGSAGVGKTHNHKKIISLIESSEFTQSEIFKVIQNNEELLSKDEINKTFETIKNENRFEFITFHQSFSYEDFIEGFRPNEDGKINLEDGIFKNICDKARKNLKDSQKDIHKLKDDFNFEKLIEKFNNKILETLENEEKFILDGKVLIEAISDNESYMLGGSIKSNTQRLTIDIIRRDYEDFKNDLIQNYEDVKPTRESKRNYHGNARYYFMLYKKLSEFEKTLNLNNQDIQKEELKNFYLVIDEINRGNISKIFGELITLLEEDKRDSYSVKLPYSKDNFSVPSNLYIIATMNSTDKSIALIDVALRRRFTFIKMLPNENLIKYPKAKELFIDLNKIIKNDLGEDFLIGHSYFMKIKNSEDLNFVIEYKIKPLIEEYYYANIDRQKEIFELLDRIEKGD